MVLRLPRKISTTKQNPNKWGNQGKKNIGMEKIKMKSK